MSFGTKNKSSATVAVVEYGVGNLFSLQCSLQALGVTSVITSNAKQLAAASHIILPGVGAFGDARQKLAHSKLDTALTSLAGKGKPLLGICLGMQLLFERSYEFGTHEGLGLIPGEVCPLEPDLRAGGFAYKVPHIGWNSLTLHTQSALTKYIKNGDYMYYVHSYYATKCEKNTAASSGYGVQVPGIVQNKNVYGTQFHPEKSGDKGLGVLRAFLEV